MSSLDLLATQAGFARWSRSRLSLDPFTAVAGFLSWICSELALHLLAGFARYSCRIALVSCRLIPALLLQDSLADSLAGFARRIRSALELDSLVGVTPGCRWTRSLLSVYLLDGFARYSCWITSVSCQWILALLWLDFVADLLAGFARWICSLLKLHSLAGVAPYHTLTIREPESCR
jgi:hypothetical protein